MPGPSPITEELTTADSGPVVDAPVLGTLPDPPDVLSPTIRAATKLLREAPTLASLRARATSDEHFLALRRERHWSLLDAVEVLLAQVPGAEVPTAHNYTPGLYSREMRPCAGTLITSQIHLREHQWVLMQGACMVWTEEQEEPVLVRAPFRGVTIPGTRRLILVLEDCVWCTFHPLEPDLHNANLNDIEERLYERRDEHLRGLPPAAAALPPASRDDTERSNLCRQSPLLV